MNKKRRKTLDDVLAEEFVYGKDDTPEREPALKEEQASISQNPEPKKNTSPPKSETKQSKSDQTHREIEHTSSAVKQQNQPLRKTQKKVKAEIQNLSTQSDSADLSIETPSRSPKSKNKNKELSLMEKLQVQPKEVTKRFTVDLPESMHRKLSILAAKTGRTKADIVRLLLQDALQDVED
jgi:hypothetical protein